MDALNFRDTEFFLAQQRVKRWWLGPIFFAVCLHVLAVAASISLPSLLAKRPLLDEIVTVNLVALPEVEIAKPKPVPNNKVRVSPVVKKQKLPEIVKPEVQVPELVKPTVVKLKSAAPISIKPKKRKRRRAKDTRLADEKEKEKKLIAQKRVKEQRELERKQRLAQARLDELRAEQAAKRAREELASLIRTSDSSSRNTRSSGSRQVSSVVLKQYLSAVDERLRRYWILPDMRKWNKGLETVVVLTIQKDGTVLRKMIEKKSNDPFYDQFVMKTIQSSLPMPPFPALMSRKTIEVGIRFRPGELLM